MEHTKLELRTTSLDCNVKDKLVSQAKTTLSIYWKRYTKLGNNPWRIEETTNLLHNSLTNTWLFENYAHSLDLTLGRVEGFKISFEALRSSEVETFPTFLVIDFKWTLEGQKVLSSSYILYLMKAFILKGWWAVWTFIGREITVWANIVLRPP